MSTLGSLRKIEAMIHKKFSSKCDPNSLVKSIAKEVSKNRVKSPSIKGEFIVPDDYTLILGEIDFQRLSSARVLKSLYEMVERQTIHEDAFIDGKLTIRFEKSTEGSGLIQISSRFAREDTGKFTPRSMIQTHEESEVEPDTIIIDRKNFETLRNIPMNFASPTEHEIAILKVTSQNFGSDSDLKLNPSDSELILGGNQISIGRKEICDLTLQDISVSRIHANISYERHRHIIRDKDSHNGTSVNGKRIDRDGIFLRDGDMIQLGNSVLKYESL